MIKVKTAIEFRDVVMDMGWKEQVAYVRAQGDSKTYRVINPSQMADIELVDLFDNEHPPVLMETIAAAMHRADRRGEPVPVIEIRSLDEL